MTRIVVDPVTRIEGHLRIEAELDGSNTITKAYSSGTMVRGIEKILKGRDPREAWVFTQRTCGVCTTVHAFASIRAVENALGIAIPPAANAMRNMMIAQQYVHDHVMHFYHLHALDWVDVVAALDADPKKTSEVQQSISAWPNSSPEYFAGVKAKVQTVVDSGQLGIFGSAYWGHPAYKLPPEIDLLAVAHYLEALDWQRDVVQIHTILGGKNPHPNFVVGGVPLPIDLDAELALNAERLAVIAQSIGRIRAFVDQVYIPDLLAIAPYYVEYAGLGGGPGNYLSWGEFPGDDPEKPDSLLVPAGVVTGNDPASLTGVDAEDRAKMLEFVKRSWYKYDAGDDKGLHPYEGETEFDYTGPKPPYEFLDVDAKYTWLKAPRWDGKAMEVGPLARVLMMYATGNAEVKQLVDAVLGALKAPLEAVFSTLGRTAARGIETKVFADALSRYYDQLIAHIDAGQTDTFNGEKWDPGSWPGKAEGVGLMEAPRGALGHWIVIEDGKIANYQQVVPTTWNASPRDAEDQPGAYEVSLVGTKLAIPEQPLELLRTIHSFDPCMACAIHLVDARGEAVSHVSTGLNVCLR